jgi:NADH:ubiquinone oxidoreductase subunit H
MSQPVEFLPRLGWVAWLCAYALLVLLQSRSQEWLLLRFHRRRRRTVTDRSGLVIRMADSAGSLGGHRGSSRPSQGGAAKSLSLRGARSPHEGNRQANQEGGSDCASPPLARDDWAKLVPSADRLHSSLGTATVIRVSALAFSVIAGAAIPLAPRIQGLELGDAALLYVLGLDWISAGLLIVADHVAHHRAHLATLQESLGIFFLNALPTVLLVLAMTMTASSLASPGTSSLGLARIVELQGGWNGIRWLGVYQPLALFLWLACAAPMRPTVHRRRTVGWQMHALNRALLTGALFLGGWQGPLALRHPVLGLFYTVVKVGLVTFGWVWAWASLPQPEVYARSRLAWRFSLPLATIVLVATSFAAAA